MPLKELNASFPWVVIAILAYCLLLRRWRMEGLWVFSLKTAACWLLEVRWMRAVRANISNFVVAIKLKQRPERSSESTHNYPWLQHYNSPVSYLAVFRQILIIADLKIVGFTFNMNNYCLNNANVYLMSQYGVNTNSYHGAKRGIQQD